MQYTPGTRLGTYEILGAIGAGGMGEVLLKPPKNGIVVVQNWASEYRRP